MTAATIDLWTIDLDAGPAAGGALLEVLSGEERSRAARLRTSALRLRFIAAHGALRTILGRYLEVAPGALRIETTAAGKPFVRDTRLAFNLSHSDGLALCAIGWGGRIGIDVERLSPLPDADGIVARYFAKDEAARYEALPSELRLAAFFSLWTRKEAFVKAIGDGLQCPLASFEVDIDPATPSPKIVCPTHGGDWHLRSLSPAAGYIAAVARDRAIAACEHFLFNPSSLRSSGAIARVLPDGG